jgi:hypothetical protein
MTEHTHDHDPHQLRLPLDDPPPAPATAANRHGDRAGCFACGWLGALMYSRLVVDDLDDVASIVALAVDHDHRPTPVHRSMIDEVARDVYDLPSTFVTRTLKALEHGGWLTIDRTHRPYRYALRVPASYLTAQLLDVAAAVLEEPMP